MGVRRETRRHGEEMREDGKGTRENKDTRTRGTSGKY